MSQSWNDVGVDLGKRRLAIGWPACGLSAAIDLKKPGDRGSELLALQRWIATQVPVETQLWIELPYVSNGPAKNQNTSLSMAETVGVILAAQPWQYSPVMVNQSTWKAQVVGNGRASKDEVALYLSLAHPALYEATGGQEDQIDAMCIGLYGKLRSQGVIHPPEPKKPRTRR